MKKYVSLLLVLVIVCSYMVSCKKVETIFKDEKATKYDQAMELIEGENYAEAYKILSELGDYKDAQKLLKRFKYTPTSITANEMYGNSEESIVVNFTYTESNLPKQCTVLYSDEEYEKYYMLSSCDYNEDGKLIRMNFKDTDDNEITYDYAYDENGNVIKMVCSNLWWFGDAEIRDIEVYDYTYDAMGNLIKEISTDMSGNQSTADYTYDTNNNLIIEVHTSSNNKTTTSYIYDARGNLIKAKTNDKTIDYTYDDNDNLVKEVHSSSSGVDATYKYTYDAKGNLIKTVYTSNWGYSFVSDYKYDANNNLILVITTEDDNSVTTIEVEYDYVYIPFDQTDEEWETIFERLLYYI